MAAILTLFLGLVIHFATRCSTETMTCPAQCSCDLWLGLRRTRCHGGHLYSVDAGAARETQALDLPGNSISAIDDREIANIGLTQLKYLNLSNNAISEIGLDAFAGLKELTVLDLSRNRLHYLLQDVFSENDNLRVLRLSGNYFETHVPKLQSPSIMDLSLDFCQIDHLPLDTFRGLSLIRSLDLSGNMMIQLDIGALESLWNLQKISLQGNPWSCNNAVRQLADFLINRSVDFEEICPGLGGERKFEKIVVAPGIGRKKQKKIQAKFSNASVTMENFPEFSTRKPAREGVNFPERLSGRWIFLGGFACGVVAGIALSFICLGIFLCRKKRRRRRNDPQRVSLLGNFWSENLRGNSQRDSCRRNGRNSPENRGVNWWEISGEDERARNLAENRRVESVSLPCPGTPPPAYREVMLRPALYRSPTTPRRGIPPDP